MYSKGMPGQISLFVGNLVGGAIPSILEGFDFPLEKLSISKIDGRRI